MAGRGTSEEEKRGSTARALHFQGAKDQDASLITSSAKKPKKAPGHRASNSAAAKRLNFLPSTAKESTHVELATSPELKRRKVQPEAQKPDAEDQQQEATLSKPQNLEETGPAEEAHTAVPPRPAPELPPGIPAPPIPQGKHPLPGPVHGHLPPEAKSKGVLQTIFSPMFHLFQQPEDGEPSSDGVDTGAPQASRTAQARQGQGGSPRKVARSRSCSPEQLTIPEEEQEIDQGRTLESSEAAQQDELRLEAERKENKGELAGTSKAPMSDGASSTDEESETCLSVQPLSARDSEGESEAGEELYVDNTGNDMEDDSLEFDPYAFIKSLPPLEQCAPAWRRSLLPKQTRQCKRKTLVLDLDETLVHSTLDGSTTADFCFEVFFNNCTHSVNVRQRPHLSAFLERCSSLFEVVVFTASQKLYAEQLLNILDPHRKLIRYRIFRDDCLFVDGNYLKDLTVLGRDLAHTVIVDNSPQAFGFQLANGVPIESWYDDASDTELVRLLPFLESLVEVPDVRPLIANAFKLHNLVAKAPRY